MRTASRWIHGTLGAMLACLFLFSASAAGQAPGPEVCKNCHTAHVDTYSASIHGKKEHPRSPASAGGCVACHGDATKHVEAGGGRGVGGMINLSSKSIPAEKR